MSNEKILDKNFTLKRNIWWQTGQGTLQLRNDLELLPSVSIGKGTIIEPGVKLYPNVKIGRNCILATDCVIKGGCEIGDNTIIGTKTNLEGKNKIGSWTTIQAQCHLTMDMEVGNNVFIGPLLMTVNTPKIGERGSKFGYPNTTNMPRKIPKIENGVQMGGGVSIAPGVVVGKNCVIGMNCLLKKSVKPNFKVRSGWVYPDDYEVLE